MAAIIARLSFATPLISPDGSETVSLEGLIAISWRSDLGGTPDMRHRRDSVNYSTLIVLKCGVSIARRERSPSRRRWRWSLLSVIAQHVSRAGRSRAFRRARSPAVRDFGAHVTRWAQSRVDCRRPGDGVPRRR